jgi:hypothetical protein
MSTVSCLRTFSPGWIFVAAVGADGAALRDGDRGKGTIRMTLADCRISLFFAASPQWHLLVTRSLKATAVRLCE